MSKDRKMPSFTSRAADVVKIEPTDSQDTTAPLLLSIENTNVVIPRKTLMALCACIREVRKMTSGLVEIAAAGVTVTAFRDPERLWTWFVSFSTGRGLLYASIYMHDQMVEYLERLLTRKCSMPRNAHIVPRDKQPKKMRTR